MKLLPYGPTAVLAEFDTLQEAMSAAAAWRRQPPTGALEFVPAARTVLIRHDGTFERARLAVPADDGIGAVQSEVGDAVVIDVVYDGADLEDVATALRLSVDDVIRIHTDARYTVAFCGFLPGFSYLVGLPPALRLPRRSTPRTRVPAGSVAIADEFSAVYPRVSPGGWHLLGRTDAVMWADDREPPALLPPGCAVRFRAR